MKLSEKQHPSIYDREIYLYKRVLEEFRKFQEDREIDDPFTSTAKLYGYSVDDVEECLVMENLKTVGYQLWEKKIPMNPDHIKAVLIEYAKYHAVSFAMKQNNPKLFEYLTKSIGNIVHDHGEDTELIKKVFQISYKVLEDDPVLTACVKRVEGEIHDVFSTGFKLKEYKLVISHGDCWCNNFLFKYQDSKDTKTPSSLKILDWQLSFLTTPAYDICYFLVTNGCQEVFDDFETYLQLYYDTLKKQLKKFNCDVEELFPHSTYKEHIKKFMVFAVYFGIMVLKIALSNQDEAPNFAESGDFIKALNFDIGNMENYIKRLSMIIRFVDENKYV